MNRFSYSKNNHDEQDSRALVIGAVLILLVGGYFIVRAVFFSNSDEEVKKDSTSLSEEIEKNKKITITPDIVRQKLINNEPIKFIDLRTADAFATEHIPNSVLLSTTALSTYVPDPNDILVIVYGEDDIQTYEIAKNIITERSLTAFFIEGGYEGWKRTSNQTISQGDPNSFIDQSKIVYIGAPELLKLMNNPESNLVIIDVQSKANFERVHIQNAINIPLNELEKRSKEIPANTPLVVYGENEFVSFQAGVRLADLNVFTAKTLSGNKNLTSESGLSLEPKL